MAQFGRALRSGRRGRKFKSCHLDQKSSRCFCAEGFFLSVLWQDLKRTVCRRQIVTFRWTVTKPGFVPPKQFRRASLVTSTSREPRRAIRVIKIQLFYSLHLAFLINTINTPFYSFTVRQNPERAVLFYIMPDCCLFKSVML